MNFCFIILTCDLVLAALQTSKSRKWNLMGKLVQLLDKMVLWLYMTLCSARWDLKKINLLEDVADYRDICNLGFSLMQLDVTSAQLLVTDNDFRDPDFRRQLNETVKSLLSLKVVPIFNENDAVSTRKAPYEVNYWLYALIKFVVLIRWCTIFSWDCMSTKCHNCSYGSDM